MPPISPQFVQAVAPDLPVINARIAILFGNQTRQIVHKMAIDAAKLYHAGKIKKIIVTGGVPFEDKKDNITEAEYTRKVLLARGVKGKHIIFENKSSNTYENVINAKRALLKAEGIIRREPILCMGREYATSRFLMTMAKNWPEALASFKGFEVFPRAKHEWHHCPNISEMLTMDHGKWPSYIASGHIKPINIGLLKARLCAISKPKKLLT